MLKLLHGLLSTKNSLCHFSSSRYLNRGKRHTVCEQGLLLGGKARRSATRESTKERSLTSRRASDTSSNFTNTTARAHLERLYNNAVNLKASDEDLTTSSLQELQKLQKQVQKVCFKRRNHEYSYANFILVSNE
jgi:hypothetical protein